MTTHDSPARGVITLRLQGPFSHDGGHAWLAPVEIEGDGIGIGEYCSDLSLFENDTRIGPARSSHAVIRERGNGRFSHWQKSIYFAASDNTDPNTNGRIYTATVTPRDVVEERVNYGLKLTRQYMELLGIGKDGSDRLPLKDLKIFEVGPGPSMTTAMAIAAWGGIVYVREREPIQWEPKFHGETAGKMLDILRQTGERFDPEPLERCLAQSTFDPAHIIVVNRERSVVANMLAGAIDHTVSVAVLEHVEDIKAELAFLHQISKENSKGAHVVDFRDHHNFEKPLEFLALNEEEFIESCQYRFSRGNRLRFQQLQQVAESIGFRVDKRVLTETEPEYLKEFVPRLRQSPSRFRDIPADWLTTLSAVVYLEKP